MELFVPWDSYMREHYELKKDANGYISYLEKMQQEFRGIKPVQGKTLAKAIDEYNYITISIPALEAKRKKDHETNERKKAQIKEFKIWQKQKL